MKIYIAFILSFFAITVLSGELIPTESDIHPEVFKVLKHYAPLQKGGFRIEKFSDEQYIIVGIGKARLNSSFSQAVRTAELDAELQIAKAVNPTRIEVDNSRVKSSVISPDGDVRNSTFHKKIIQMMVSSHTPFIASCGIWKDERNLYCARAVFVGNFNHGNRQSHFSSQVSNLTGDPEVLKIIENLSFLRNGGTFLTENNKKKYLLTIVAVPKGIPFRQKMIQARNLAYKNITAFISGGKLEQDLIVVTEKMSSENGDYQSRRSKRKNLESSVKGSMQFISPQASWEIKAYQSEFFLYLIDIEKHS